MKKIFSILLSAAIITSCTHKDNKRYFLISYDITTRHDKKIGTFYQISEYMPSNNDLMRSVWNRNKCEFECSLSNCIVTGISEFKDSSDMTNFSGISEFISDNPCKGDTSIVLKDNDYNNTSILEMTWY